MKKIIVSMMTGLFLITGVGLTAQPRGNGNGNGPRQAFRTYMEQNIKPELMKQKKIWMEALTKEETEELLKLKEQRDAIRESMKGQQTNMADREQMREAHFSAFKGQLDKITDAHPDLKAQYTKEMTKMKEQWVKDIEAMRPANNRGMGNGPQNILDKMTDPAFILMWNPQMNYGKMMMRHHRMNQKNNMGMGQPGMMGNRGMNGMKGMNGGQMDRGPKANEPGIHIFPQPAESTTVIKISGVINKDVQASVYNAKGKKIKELYKGTATLPMLDYTLNVSDWANGIYTVKVTFGDRNMSMDFKVEKE